MSRVIDINDNYRGTATIIELQITEDDIPESISRGTVWLSIADENGDEFLKKYFVSFKDASSGLCDITITGAENSTVGVYDYWIVYVESNGTPHLLATGKYTILDTFGSPFTLKSTTTTTSSSTTSSTTTAP